MVADGYAAVLPPGRRDRQGRAGRPLGTTADASVTRPGRPEVADDTGQVRPGRKAFWAQSPYS